jgi:hypothetical protein
MNYRNHLISLTEVVFYYIFKLKFVNKLILGGKQVRLLCQYNTGYQNWLETMQNVIILHYKSSTLAGFAENLVALAAKEQEFNMINIVNQSIFV